MQTPDKILRIGEVTEIVGLSRPTIYRLIKDDKFPKPIKVTSWAVGWRRSRVEAWLDAREQAS